MLQVDPKVWQEAYESLFYDEDSDGTDPFTFTERSFKVSESSEDESDSSSISGPESDSSSCGRS